MQFKLESEFSPTGDQPSAIKQLVDGLNDGEDFQTLLGVTGSGKTFTIANVIKEVNRPTLVLSHNKTLAAQLLVNSSNSFLIMQWNILYLITTTINQKPIFLAQELILKKIYP